MLSPEARAARQARARAELAKPAKAPRPAKAPKPRLRMLWHVLETVGPDHPRHPWPSDQSTPYPARRRYVYLRCRCVCGAEKLVLRDSVVGGASKSCGCRGVGRQYRATCYPQLVLRRSPFELP